MTLLEEIQSAAVDANSDLGTLLRKCKLLATRLDNKHLEDWLLWESNGYPKDVKVPTYRVWSLEVKGHFMGPFGSGIRNAPIPWACLPENIRKSYQEYECRQSIAGIETMVAQAHKGNGRMTISTGDLALYLRNKVYQDQECVQAWAECGTGRLVEILNTVRNRILDFSLAVWKEAPDAGEPGTHAKNKIKTARVTQIFHTTVYGGSANLVGTAPESTITFNIGTKDFKSLEHVLHENGVKKTDLIELKGALESEDVKNQSEGFGPKVSTWIAKMMQKAADGSWNIGLGAAGNLLARAIAKYYGLGN